MSVRAHIGLFLAVLELAKGRRIVPEQAALFGDILLSLAPSNPAVEETPLQPSSDNNP